MSKRKFLERLVGAILPIVFLNIIGIEILMYFVMSPTFDETKIMLTYPLPPAIAIIVIYFVVVSIYSRPIFLLLEADKKGEVLDEGMVRLVQDRCVDHPYLLADLSFPAYISGMVVGVLIVTPILGWPRDTWVYGLLAGIIAGLMTTPMAIYASGYVVEPILQRTMALSPDHDAARIAGWRFPLRNKFIMIVIVLVVSIVGYAMIVGYSQTDAVLKNMEKMEQVLPPSVAYGLLDRVENTTDPGIRSSRYFRSRMGSLQTFYFMLLLVGSGLALIITYAAARETTKPIRILQSVAEQISRGNYDEPVRLVSNNEFAELGVAFNRMRDTIAGQIKATESILETLRSGIMGVDETVSTVLSVSAEQSKGASKQASAVQETSSTVEEMTVIAKEIMERAKMVDEVASKTLIACHDGQRRLDQVQGDFQEIMEQVDAIRDAMVVLEDRFREVYRIVELIDKVAEQTELLSVSASLEAAGAGAEERRFSVVATSTRSLAVKARETAKEIRALVEIIQEATKKSTRVAEAGREKVAVGVSAISGVIDALQTISLLAGSTSSAVREITVSTEQQTSASEQLASAISEVNEVAGQVEDGAKEVDSAIVKLRNFAEALRTTAEKSSSIQNGF
ncbi:MAG: methyl-accepting chemotaxis protein [Deltaproteobacteria bacterium]|nr:MAG: methyl-accepting chemotaxis protein [Deltaproteobacteria bacterium]